MKHTAFTRPFSLLAGLMVMQASHADLLRPMSRAEEGPGVMAGELAKQSAQLTQLRDQATAVTTKMAELAGSKDFKVSDETVELMKSMLGELEQINARLKAAEADIQKINAWISEREKVPAATGQTAQTKTHNPSSYVQFQFRDSDDLGAETSAFAVRKSRLGHEFTIDPNTSMKISVELASGSDGLAAQLRDAFGILTPTVAKGETKMEYRFGQMPLALGYELSRSDTTREFPERSIYANTMFSSERGRGVSAKASLATGMSLTAGVYDALSVTDPEQTGRPAGPDGKLAFVGALRFAGENFDVGVSGLAGARPDYTDNANNFYERTTRQFIYLDGMVTGLLVPQITLRAEAMFGRDRLPVRFDRPAPGRGTTDMSGFHTQISYAFNDRNKLSVRFEQFDPDTDTGNNMIDSFGIAYSYVVTPGATLVFAWERVEDPSRPRSYNVTTIRTQFKF